MSCHKTYLELVLGLARLGHCLALVAAKLAQVGLGSRFRRRGGRGGRAERQDLLNVGIGKVLPEQLHLPLQLV